MSVFHLKYRPLKLVDLDSSVAVKGLTNILSAKEIPQALLFAGPKGAGKTSAARIVARSLNCLKPDGVDPCGDCDNCREIISGNSLDVIEIDAASNRGIDEARSLKDKAYLSPAKLRKKVFVIDEVHMMTKDAFNALLKLLEEPPKQTVFILCTTDEAKIPETVLSRLVKVPFEKGEKSEMVKSLQRVIDGEKIKVSEQTLDKIVSNCDRSFRNLHKLFNEIFLETGVKMDDDKVEQFLSKRLGEYSPSLFETDLKQNSLTTILQNLEKMADGGVDFKSFRERMIGYFQSRLLQECGVGQSLKEGLDVGRLEKLLQLLIGAGKMETESYIPQLPLQLVVVEFLNVKSGSGSGKIMAEVDNTSANRTVKVVAEAQGKFVEVTTDKKSESLNIKVGFGVDKVVEEWGKVLQAVKPYNHSVEAFLRAVRPNKISGNRLVCDVFYPFHKDKLEEQKNRQIVEKGLRDVFGVDLEFECVLASSKREPIVVQNDTPEEVVAPTVSQSGDEMYDVAKQIFG
jgi:DNA polymerase-3 subunit gamma/tau